MSNRMTQTQMYERARDQVASLCKTFDDIMSGPNPLTPVELRTMARMRPQYGFMDRWADRIEANEGEK